MRNTNKKLLEKLIKKIGWESVLYETLKELFQNVNPPVDHEERGLHVDEDAYEEAKEVLEAYEEYTGSEIVKAAELPKTDPVMVSSGTVPGKVSNSKLAVERSQLYSNGGSKVVGLENNTNKESIISFPKRNEEQEIVSRVVVTLPLSEVPKSNFQLLRTAVQIDKDLGQSQGILPIPNGCQIINRDKLHITTKSGLFLGRGEEDGQIKESHSQHVSGYVRANGKYGLVFKDSSLGEAVIHYEVLPEREPKRLELEMITLPDNEDWVSFVQDPEVLVKADTVKMSMELLLDALARDHNMEVVSSTVLKAPKGLKESIRYKPKV